MHDLSFAIEEFNQQLLELSRPESQQSITQASSSNKCSLLSMNYGRKMSERDTLIAIMEDIPQWPASKVLSFMFGKNCSAVGIFRSLR